MRVKYRFSITYQTEKMKQVSDFMDKLDLGIGDICTEHKIEFTSTEQSLLKVKNTLTQAYESAGAKVFKIEGGKIQ